MNLYDKFEESGEKIFENIIRLEVQVKKKRILKNLKDFGISRHLFNYWNYDSFENYFIDFLSPYLYKSNYFRVDVARKKIRNCNELSKTLQNNLCKFINTVNKYGLGVTRNKYNYTTMRKYLKLLDEVVGINPVCFDTDLEFEELENLLTKAIKISNEKYFDL